MPDPLTDPLQLPAPRWQSVDPPIMQQTVTALGWAPPSLLSRVMRDASVGVTMAGFRMQNGMTAFAAGISMPRNVWIRFARACRQADLPNPIRPGTRPGSDWSPRW